ncbi:NTP transferase domain-containing protein [Methylocystis sp. Sn-Cys]|uniref:nucleotidyltransferase family protein n=1 Tax=Methylocystis sp. Sn-Cys TaxID=1701263 RepID=UPI001921FCC0|nr:nucleotidyltransferase family protein [Methylocystis sp. Sn-Cys]MBL1257513.1 nucleotidyltransferase family protein [Methylocystis sp. Sn-Cys]
MCSAPVVAAIILAAGRGARFSADENKLLAPLDGQPLLRHVAETALASRASRVIVVTGHEQREVAAALAGLPVSYAHNMDYASGLASSLRIGLAAAEQADGALILLGDMPAVSAPVLDALMTAFEAAPHCAAVVPVCQGVRGNPVLLARTLFPQLERLRGDEGARRLLRRVDGVVELSIDDPGILADVDTPADLVRLTRSRYSRS